MQQYRIRWTHAIAVAMAGSAIAYQSALIWEMLGDSVTLTTKLGVPLATISAAMCPVLAEAAARAGQRGKAFLLTVPVLVLLAFVLPSGISRLGEAQQTRIATATIGEAEQARIRADLARAEKLVAQAEAWVSTECASGNGAKCKGQTFTLNQRQAYRDKLSSQIHDLKPVTQPWLPAWHPALLPIGLELAILALLFYGLGPVTIDRRAIQAANVVPFRRPEPQAITERPEGELTDAEIEEAAKHINGDGVMNRTLARQLGVSEGQATKIVDAGVAAGKFSRETDPNDKRRVIIRKLAA